MRSAKGLTAVLAATVAFVAGLHGAAAGPITVSNVYTVGGQAVPGVETGLVLSGGSVTVVATGAVCPFGTGFCPGPDGVQAWNTTQSSYGGFPLPGGPAWGLVGRVGSGPWVQVGSGPTKLTGTGSLVFAVNDDLLVDNTGSFTVTVSYACWPGWGYGDKNHVHCGPPGLSSTKRGAGAARGPNGQGKGVSGADRGSAGNGVVASDSGADAKGNGNGKDSSNGKGSGADTGASGGNGIGADSGASGGGNGNVTGRGSGNR
jgi:hypothetical protein